MRQQPQQAHLSMFASESKYRVRGDQSPPESQSRASYSPEGASFFPHGPIPMPVGIAATPPFLESPIRRTSSALEAPGSAGSARSAPVPPWRTSPGRGAGLQAQAVSNRSPLSARTESDLPDLVHMEREGSCGSIGYPQGTPPPHPSSAASSAVPLSSFGQTAPLPEASSAGGNARRWGGSDAASSSRFQGVVASPGRDVLGLGSSSSGGGAHFVSAATSPPPAARSLGPSPTQEGRQRAAAGVGSMPDDTSPEHQVSASDAEMSRPETSADRSSSYGSESPSSGVSPVNAAPEQRRRPALRLGRAAASPSAASPSVASSSPASPSARSGFGEDDLAPVCNKCCFRNRSARTVEEGAEEDEEKDEAAGVAYKFVAAFAKNGPSRCPCLFSCCGMIMSIALVAVGILLRPPEIETDFSAFMKTDVRSSILRDSFLYTLSFREDLGGSVRRLGQDVFMNFDLQVAYQSRDGHSLFQPDMLAEIVRFETALVEKPMWKALCAESVDWNRDLCARGLSFANYAKPTVGTPEGELVPSTFIFNGRGPQSPAAITARALKNDGIWDVVFPREYAETDATTTYLRTAFRFRIQWCCAEDPSNGAVVRELKDKWEALLSKEFIPFLQEAERGKVNDKYWPLTVYYDGRSIESIQVWTTMLGDLKLTCGAVVFVWFYLMFHTRRFLLSLFALVTIILCVPLAYVMFTVTTGSARMHVVSGLSLFLMVGLGSDVVFVYTDFWTDSKEMRKTVKGRMSWTLYQAGKASLVTSATTAVSFFANLASVLKPLREFGFFMGLCVMLVWFLLTALLLPVCLLEDNFCGCCRMRSRQREPDPSEPRRPDKHTGRMRSATKGLFRWRRSCVVLAVVLGVIALFWSLKSVMVDTGMPSIFPENHNQNRGKKVIGAFKPYDDVIPNYYVAPNVIADICSESTFGNQDNERCALFWCDTVPDYSVAQAGHDPSTNTCQCFRKPITGSCSSSTALVLQRWAVHREGSFDVGAAARSYLGNFTGVLNQNTLAPLIQQEWESGQTAYLDLTQVQASVPRTLGEPCGYEDVCFCGAGTRVCKLAPEWRSQPFEVSAAFFSASGPKRRLEAEGTPSASARLVDGRPVEADERGLVLAGGALAAPAQRTFLQRTSPEGPFLPGRRLQAEQWMVPSNRRAMVEVVFGMDVTLGPRLLGEANMDSGWNFKIGHDPSFHWAQRNLYFFCRDVADVLRVVDSRCWMMDFRKYIIEQGELFPVPSPDLYHSLLTEFLRWGLTGDQSTKRYLWMREGVIKASFMSFSIDVSKYASPDDSLRHMSYWTDYLASWNAGAHVTAVGAWHTASLWVQAQAQAELISSTITTLIIVLLLAFLGMLVFTGDIVLSCLVVACTILTISGLIFFIVVMMGWAIGPIEVIALIVFIGYAVTYSLHIAHRYGSHEADQAPEAGVPDWLSPGLSEKAKSRQRRVAFALRSMGGAAVGSAMTTIGCSIFLLCCTLTIFKKLGGVVLAVTIMSIFVALVPLPASLLLVGPWAKGGFCPSFVAFFKWMEGVSNSESAPASASAPPLQSAVELQVAAAAMAAAVMAEESLDDDYPTPLRNDRAEPPELDIDISTIFWWARDSVSGGDSSSASPDGGAIENERRVGEKDGMRLPAGLNAAQGELVFQLDRAEEYARTRTSAQGGA
mmetsp:Transcript_1232/g.5043  ORF Transcript_1232/g.5043 Transcript_1232/m.5043 type:complete len:1657 (-) Transcript_1232:580-5550(-)